MDMARRTNRGITLIELLIALSILAVLMGAAAPAFGNLIASGATRSARSALSVALNQARMTAVSRSAHVVACPSVDQATCTGSTRWDAGWLVFVDTNRDGKRNANEDLVGVAQHQGQRLAIMSTTGRTRVNYRPDGSATGSNVTITFCDQRGARNATALAINNAGRVRTSVPSASAIANACAAANG